MNHTLDCFKGVKFLLVQPIDEAELPRGEIGRDGTGANEFPQSKIKRSKVSSTSLSIVYALYSKRENRRYCSAAFFLEGWVKCKMG